jgi:chromosome segregation ATPase
MNDVTAEKLVLKVTNLVEEVNDVNLLVRRIPPPQETINKIHERIEATQAAVREMKEAMIKFEEAIRGDQAATKELEKQAKALLEGQKAAAAALDRALAFIRDSASEMCRKVAELKQEAGEAFVSVTEKQGNLNGRISFCLFFCWVCILLLLYWLIFQEHIFSRIFG